MDTYIIQGGIPLAGVVEARGSKNAATKMMIASLLTQESCEITNIPFSGETDITKELCNAVGCEIAFTDDHRGVMRTREVKTSVVPELSRRNRIPILALGPLLHRKGFAEVPVVGGDPIGHRPINFHIEALNQMGVTVEWRERSYYAEAHEIRGADIDLPYPSVGATENVLLTATLAKGTTVISNAAVEPEIICLVDMLNAMGGKITADAEARRIVVEGVNGLHGASRQVIPDRNEVVSFAAAAVATGGKVMVRGAREADLIVFIKKLRDIGATCEVSSEGITFSGGDFLKAVDIETAPHPGFMTDWQQPFCVLLTRAEGTSIVHETVYEDRFGYARDLNRMGAAIVVSDECPSSAKCRFSTRTFNHVATIEGPRRLQGREIAMTDIRAGMAHVIAALAAEGESRITGIEHLDRGYEKIDERLCALGADIKRI